MEKIKERRYIHKFFIDKFIIRNFKSIDNLELDLNPGVNVLVGRNAAGKSNILEAIYFLRKALIEEASKIPYIPHLPYWSGKDLFYMKDVSKPIELGFRLKEYIISHDRKKYLLTYSVLLSFYYKPDIDSIDLAGIKITYGDNYSILNISKEGIQINYRKEVIDEIESLLNRKGIKVRDKKEIKKSINEIKKNNYVVIERLKFPSLLKLINIERIFIWFKLTDIDNYKLFNVPIFPLGIKGLLINKLESPVEEAIHGVEVANYSRISFFPDVFRIIRKVLEGITLLKHPDMGALKEPRPAITSEYLDVRGTNLSSILLGLISKHGRVPEEIDYMLNKFFPNMRILPRLVAGKVILEFYDGELNLSPHCIPDGLIKALAILIAIESKPFLLLIDEIENSMHLDLLQYIYDKLNSLEIPVIVATHSSEVINLVGPERTFVTERDEYGRTTIRKFKNSAALRKRLSELGIVFSDYLMPVGKE